VLGELRRNVLAVASQQAEPWRGRICGLVNDERVSSAKTVLVLGLSPDGSVASSAWITLPDPSMFTGILRAAFIAGVYTDERLRGRHFATDAVERGCRVAARSGAECALLAASDQRLYRRIGFTPVEPDPSLMLRHLGASTQSRVIPVIRQGTANDLATVQSICAQPHLLICANDVNSQVPSEVEQEFCQGLSSSYSRQYLISAFFQAQWFTAWCKRDDPQGKVSTKMLPCDVSYGKRVYSRLVPMIAELEGLDATRLRQLSSEKLLASLT
jgi:hypothetical protein